MSFFKKLFGRSSGGASGSWEEPTETAIHDGYTIAALPMKEGAQFRLAGTISKEINGEIKTHKLIRADMFGSADECASFTITKAKQVIKEQGDRMFG
ncbi:MAG: HlyU family transcriptional regulator [Rhizobiaceae bacterium]